MTDEQGGAWGSDVGPGRFDPWPATDVHLEWGVRGAGMAATRGDVVVVVDVLSFSTTVALAVEGGATVIVLAPETIVELGGREEVGRRLGAHVVAKNRRSTTERYTLSPTTTLRARRGDRIVITSLNGARTVAAAASAPALVVASLVNASGAAAAVLAARRQAGDARVTVVACGEQWSTLGADDGLRPSVEDWYGAGAVATALAAGGLSLSPEAAAAAAAHRAAGPAVADAVRGCVSGRELIEKGFAGDVDLAARPDAAAAAPCRIEADVLGHPGAVFADRA